MAQHVITVSNLKIGDKAVVIGAGPIGVLVALKREVNMVGDLTANSLKEWEYMGEMTPNMAQRVGTHLNEIVEREVY